MSRRIPGVLLVLSLVILAVGLPIVLSGYSELQQAASSPSHLESGKHYWNAARRLPWRADLYELAGHQYYYAKDYPLAASAYQAAFQHGGLTAEGWVAWGDVKYLQNDRDGGTQTWEQALTQPGSSDKLFSRLAQVYQDRGEYARAADYLQRYVQVHAEEAPIHYRLGLLLALSDLSAAGQELIAAAQLDPQFDPAVQTLRSTLNLAALEAAPARQLVIVGRGLGLVHEWKLARAAFESATRSDPSQAEAWAWLAEADQQLAGETRGPELLADVQAHLDQALALDPASPVVQTLRGLYFQRGSNYREALAAFQAAASLKPDDPALFVSIGESFSKLGDLIRALEAYQYAANLVPEDAAYWRLLAQFCGQNNVNIDTAGIPAAQRVVVLSGETSETLDLLGWLLTLDGRNLEAERTLLRALQLDEQNASVHFHLAMLYLQTGQAGLAGQHLLRARDLGYEGAQAVLDQYFP